MTAPSVPSRPIRWYEYAVALLPCVLAFTGAIGLAIGPAACALNLIVMRSTERRVVKMAAAVGMAVLAVFLWGLATRWMV
jgi:hypothetical protein